MSDKPRAKLKPTVEEMLSLCAEKIDDGGYIEFNSPEAARLILMILGDMQELHQKVERLEKAQQKIYPWLLIP